MEIVVNSIKIDSNTRFEFVPNPKRANSMAHKRYELYSHTTNLDEYEKFTKENEHCKKYSRADLRYDVEHGHLKLFDADGNWLNEPEAKTEETSDPISKAEAEKPASRKRS